MTVKRKPKKDRFNQLVHIPCVIFGMAVTYYAIKPLVLLAILLPWAVIVYYWRTRQLKRDWVGRVFLYCGLLAIPLEAMNSEIRTSFIIDWKETAIIAVMLGAICIALILRIPALKKTEMRWNARPGIILIMLYFAAASSYFYAAITELNRMPVGQASEVHPVLVVEKYITHGRRSTSYHLVLGLWKHGEEPKPYSVAPEFYRSARADKNLCFYMHDGLFGQAWYRLDHCDGTQKRSPSSLDAT